MATQRPFDRRSLLRAGAAGMAAALAPSVLAQDKPITWKVVANTRLSSQFTVKWAWLTEQLAKRTNGRFKLEVVSFPELGMTGTELIRMLNAGLLDAGEVVTGYVSGEVPIIEGAQMVGVYENLDQARRSYEGWMKAVAEPNAKQMGGVPISTLAFTTQLLWSKFPVNTLADIKGKKIRIFAKAQADYMTALGATAVSIPIADVYSALERGVIDGCVTGPEIAAGFKYHEVVQYVTDLMLGPGAGYVVVSEKAWRGLPPDIRKEFEALLPEMRKMSWELAAKDDKQHLDTVISRGIKATIPAKPEWVPQLRKIAQEQVAPAWASRSGPRAVPAFNEVIAPIVGFTLKA
jgi:TRAP-type C4-dicarboxylate transport system substrate-binding protein